MTSSPVYPVDNGNTSLVDSSSPSPSKSRKPPSCKSCGQPRLGHPKSRCPQATDESGTDNSQKIPSPVANRYPVLKPKLVSQPTLLSLSGTSSLIVNRLFEPGIIDEQRDYQDMKNKYILEWRDKTVLFEEGELLDDQSLAAIPEEHSLALSSSDLPDKQYDQKPGRTRKLVRNMSVEQTDMFITAVCNAGTTRPVAFLIPKPEDLFRVSKVVAHRGFFVDADSDTGLLIIGRDQAAVKQMRKVAKDGGKGSFVQGMITGSALTFTALACS